MKAAYNEGYIFPGTTLNPAGDQYGIFSELIKSSTIFFLSR